MKLIAMMMAALLVGCASQPLVPAAENVKVQREDVAADCENLGALEGRNSDLRGNVEKAIEDLRLEAARKGATHVRLEATSGYGNSVRGVAYRCP